MNRWAIVGCPYGTDFGTNTNLESNLEPQQGNRNWLLRGAGCLLLLVPFVLQWVTIRSRGIDPDELEHLHAGFCVWRGMLPYRDFFEHHSPALYYFIQPAFWMYGPDLNVLWLGRAVMTLMSLATVVITWQLARPLQGELVAWTASLLLAWSNVFVLKGMELRPDVPACLCLTLMTYLTVRSIESIRFRDWLVIGLWGGLATVFTQKAIVPVVALAISVVAVRWLQRGRNWATSKSATPSTTAESASSVAWIPFLGVGLGGAVLWAVVAMLFARVGAVHDLFAGTVLQLVRLPVHSDRWEQLRPAISADLTLWLAGLLFLFLECRELARRHGEARLQVLAGTLAGSLISLAWVKAVYPQYLLLWLPLLAVAAAIGLERLRSNTHLMWNWAIVGMGLLVCGLECKLLFDGIRGTQASGLSHLRTLWNAWHFPAGAVLILPLGLLAWCGSLWRTSATRSWVLLPLAILGMSYALARDANSWLWANRAQVALIERVNSLATTQDTVLDGFTGYGALRPHANYFWWINRYSLALMTDADKSRLLTLVRDHPPSVVLYDRELKSWPELRASIEADYVPTVEPPIWIRRRAGGLRFPRIQK